MGDSTAPKLEEADIVVKNAVGKPIRNENVLSMGLIGKKRCARNVAKPLQLKAQRAIFALKYVRLNSRGNARKIRLNLKQDSKKN